MSNPNDFNTHTSSNEHDGMGIWAKHTKISLRAEDIAQKPSLFVVFGYNNCSKSYPNDLNPHTSSNEHDGIADMSKTYKFYSELKILLKNLHYLSFLAITIAVCQIQMILKLIPLQMSMMGWGYEQNIQILFWAEDIAKKPSLFVVFGYNNCSVSNPNDFNTHTSSKWAWWDGDMRKTQTFYSELKILLHYLSFLAITIAVCQIQMILTLIPLQNEHDGMGICAKHKNFIQSRNDS